MNLTKLFKAILKLESKITSICNNKINFKKINYTKTIVSKYYPWCLRKKKSKKITLVKTKNRIPYVRAKIRIEFSFSPAKALQIWKNQGITSSLSKISKFKVELAKKAKIPNNSPFQ